ncbi:MAG: NUDIX domain-containing protein [Bacteroidota bacterium]
MDYKDIVENGEQYFLPNLSIDTVIIGYQAGIIKCLLLKIGDKWLLPGGYIKREESVQEATHRVLKDRTGLEHTYLKFLAVFGKQDRQFSKVFEDFFSKAGVNWKADSWLRGRFVSLAYYALVNIAETHPVKSDIDEAFAWFDFDALPEMWMDHASIVQTARVQLTTDIQHEYHAYKLLAEEFTMPELHQLYQVILKENIDRSRFQKKMLGTGLFERLPKLNKNTPGRNPYLYRVKGALPG